MADYQGGGPVRQAVQAVCAECGQQTTVPFVPTPGRPVFCRSCFAKRSGDSGGPRSRGPPQRGPPMGGGGGPRQHVQGARKRMMAQGRKGHFMHDARALMRHTEGGMDDQHHRAFLEGLFARGARGSTADARVFLDEKLADQTITPEEHAGLARLIEQYSFWR